MWHLFMPLLVRVLITETLYFGIYHIMPLINTSEIFSQYDMYLLTGTHFAEMLKVASLSILLNLKA